MRVLCCALAAATAIANPNDHSNTKLNTDANPVSTASYDVLVYDATSGGVSAAVAAHRSGAAKVGILCASWPACFEEGGKVIGGMSTNGLGQSDIGGTDVFGGIAREFYHRNWLHYFPSGRKGAWTFWQFN